MTEDFLKFFESLCTQYFYFGYYFGQAVETKSNTHSNLYINGNYALQYMITIMPLEPVIRQITLSIEIMDNFGVVSFN